MYTRTKCPVRKKDKYTLLIAYLLYYLLCTFARCRIVYRHLSAWISVLGVHVKNKLELRINIRRWILSLWLVATPWSMKRISDNCFRLLALLSLWSRPRRRRFRLSIRACDSIRISTVKFALSHLCNTRHAARSSYRMTARNYPCLLSASFAFPRALQTTFLVLLSSRSLHNIALAKLGLIANAWSWHLPYTPPLPMRFLDWTGDPSRYPDNREIIYLLQWSWFWCFLVQLRLLKRRHASLQSIVNPTFFLLYSSIQFSPSWTFFTSSWISATFSAYKLHNQGLYQQRE